MTITLTEYLQQLAANPALIIISLLTLGVILVNGWTDAPNAIATCVSTRSMSPRKAILMAAVFNFLGVFVMTMINATVASTIYNMVDFGGNSHTALIALCAALFAIVLWATAAWYFGIPTSESHALIAGLSGAAIALQGGIGGINGSEWISVIYGLVLSSVLGFAMGWIFVKLVGAIFHESICDDIEVFYNYENLAKLVPVVREVEPEIILTQGPYDYMEDHVNAGRLAVTAAFCRGMVNMKCAPTAKPTLQNVAVYHCMPHSITDQLRRPVEADFYVNIASKMEIKRQALGCHKSQKEWLDISQGMDAYIKDMENRAAIFGKQSGVFEFAEGWVQHNPLGFGPEDFNPLAVALKDFVKLMPHAIR